MAEVCEELLVDVRRLATPFIEYNAVLNHAAITMEEGRGGGIGTVAHRLPIIYWVLGEVDKAKAYMADIGSRGYPLGPYKDFTALLSARMDEGPAPQSRYLQ